MPVGKSYTLLLYKYIYNVIVSRSGSIDSEDVRRKFVSQKETKDRLTTLKTTTENQKKELHLKCQQLNEEFEQCRFSDAQDKEQYVTIYIYMRLFTEAYRETV